MKPTSLSELAVRLDAELYADESAIALGFATDSGGVQEGDLFLAIKGSRVDGHQFVPDALRKGAVAALVEHPVEGPHLLVPNLVEALAAMAESYRDSFAGPVIGITGSAGKTTTKEFVAAALSPLGPVLKTQGNRNSEYTSPLLWADLEDDHKAVVVEMAMRGFNQIQHLASFSRLQIGLVTNIGYSHLEMVGSREGIATAKGELLEALPAEGSALLWREDDYFAQLAAMTHADVRSFGFSSDADCRITDYRILDWDRCEAAGELDGERWHATLPGIGRHFAINAAAAILTAKTVGVDIADAAKALAFAQIPPMRMEVVEFRGARVLLDTYNASPASMSAALEAFRDLPIKGRRFAVLGEMRELGPQTEEAHRGLGKEVAQAGLEAAILFGPPTQDTLEQAIQAGMDPDRIDRATTHDEIRTFLERVQPGDAVLIKGSRSLELERVIQ